MLRHRNIIRGALVLGAIAIAITLILLDRYAPWPQGREVPRAGHYVRRLLYVVLWVAAVCSLLLSARPANGVDRSGSVRRRYLLGWAWGLAALIPLTAGVATVALPALGLYSGRGLIVFTDALRLVVIPAASVWSVLLFLVYIYYGDGSSTYRDYLRPNRAVLTTLTFVAFTILLAHLASYYTVRAHVEALTAPRRLALGQAIGLRIASSNVVETVGGFLNGVDNYNKVLSECRASAGTQDERSGGCASDAPPIAARDTLLLQIVTALPELRRNVAITERGPKAISNVMRNVVDPPGNTSRDGAAIATSATGTSLDQTQRLIDFVANDPTRSELLPGLEKAEAEVARLRQDPNPSQPLAELEMILRVQLFRPAEQTRDEAQAIERSLAAIDANALRTFLWVSVLDALLVLFPWIVLLLFLLRKRGNRAAQIYDDLKRLDPTNGLLSRAIGTSIQTSQEIVRRDPKEVEKLLAQQAFSNREYVVNLIGFTILIAAGWYFILYPNGTLGFAVLTREGGGITALTSYLGSNLSLSPLTMGFAGAYFYNIQMLLRRYLADDLYPSAYLQSFVRTLVVLILGLALSALASLGAPTTGAFAALLPMAAFGAGIYPRSGVRLLLAFANKGFKNLTRHDRDLFPDSAEPDPLTVLDGVNVWTEARLLEENVENVQSLATSAVEQLVLGTHFPTSQLVDWVDQAILYLHAGDHGAWFAQLRAAGVRTASGLLHATGLAAPVLGAEDGPQDERLQRIAQAATRATSKKQAPLMTPEVVRAICESLGPDPNLKYILHYHAPTARARLQLDLGHPAERRRAAESRVPSAARP
jgi:hypothetical protein